MELSCALLLALAADAPVSCDLAPASPTQVLRTASLAVRAATGTAPLQFSWDFGDGTPPTSFSTSDRATHVYSRAGLYAVVLTVRDATGAQAGATTTQVIHEPLTPTAPTASGTILFDGAANRVWCVNPDSDSVSAVDPDALRVVVESPVGRHPRTLARAPDGMIWVANQGSASISVLDPAGSRVQTVPLPYGSQPYGIAFSPDGASAYVSLQGTGKLLRLSPGSRTVTGQVDVGPDPRGLAIAHDSSRLWVTRFVSPADRGEVVEVTAGILSVRRRIPLAQDPGPDTERGGRGVPNYLSSIAISPDGRRAWIPAKKDNTARGLFRDGLPLTFENTVRTIVAQIDLIGGGEAVRVDLNDHDLASAVAFSRHGDLAFIATQGTNTIQVFDATAVGRTIAVIAGVGLAPQGLAFDPAGRRLFVQGFLGRSIDAFDVSGVVDYTTNTVIRLGTVPVTTREKLTTRELEGKRIFYNAADRRMNRDGYLSCASCHLDGAGDGRVWDFSDRGEGLRNTTDLRGRRGTGHGPVHWTANFDEIQDFEHDVRGPFAGTGFLSDADFRSGGRDASLGGPKAGVSAVLDALAAYVTSLAETPPSPFRNPDGTLTLEGVEGRAIFARLDCARCHEGSDFTDSPRRLLHDVGTAGPGSGRRMGRPLTGLDTPTLKGIWQTAPYFHDGSAMTLDEVAARSGPAHGNIASLTGAERAKLTAYLLQIDESEGRIYREQGGRVCVEAEHAAATAEHGGRAWDLVADPTASSGAARRCGPDGSVQVDAGYVGAAPRLDLNIRFTSGGTYAVWVRGRGATTADNSVHVGLNGAAVPTSDRLGDFPPAWMWLKSTRDGPGATLEIPSPGVHTVNVWMREDGFEIDKVVLTTDLAAAISGDGPPESELEASSAAVPPAAGGSGSGGGSGGGCGALGLEVLAVLGLGAWFQRRGERP